MQSTERISVAAKPPSGPFGYWPIEQQQPVVADDVTMSPIMAQRAPAGPRAPAATAPAAMMTSEQAR